MKNEKKWYVVHTKPKNERKVADLLDKKKFRSYFPRYNEVQYWQDRRRVINAPLFTSLVFVYASENDHSTIKQIDGVSGFLYWFQKPAVINAGEIASIRSFLGQHNNVKLEKIDIVAGREDKTDIMQSQMQANGMIGFSNVHKMSLPSLGYALVSESIVEEAKIVA